MPANHPLHRFRPDDFAGTALIVLLAIVWLAGGASRADVVGQFIVRGAAWAILVAAALFSQRPRLRELRPLGFLLLATALIPLVQLVPLPPALWQSLPGRAPFAEAASASEQAQPWRPLSLVPGATANALGSLIVPVAVFLLLAATREQMRARLLGLLLALTSLSMAIGLIQFASGGFDFPFVNDTPGDVNGTFANRNHFALFMAFGCLLAPVWAFESERKSRRTGLAALALVPLFLLAILFSGSRTGLILGAVAVILAPFLVWPRISRELKTTPRWVLYTAAALIVGTFALFAFVALATDRAAGIQRLLVLDAAQDLRVRSLPTTVSIIETYFPTGSGLGTFDPMFRMHEPQSLLKPSYFNHAHNDFLELVLDTGLAGGVLLAVALGWWAWASFRAWREKSGSWARLARLGSAMLLLVAIASVFDYPARTPLGMAMIVIAAGWLCGAAMARSKAGR